MARISEIDSSSNDVKPRKENARPAFSWFIFVIPLISVAIGCLTHHTAIRHTPHGTFKEQMATSPSALRTQLGIPFHFAQGLDEILPHPWDRLLYVLDLTFVQVCSTPLGRGLFAGIIFSAFPPLAGLFIEGLKSGSPALLNATTITLITLYGQIVAAGCTFNIFLVPLFAFAHWKQVNQQPHVIRPLPFASRGHLSVVVSCLAASAATVIACLVISPDSGLPFFWASTAFQFFPLFWLPICFLPKNKAPAPRTPRLDTARVYSFLAYSTIPSWWYALYQAGPPLLRIWKTGSGFPDDASRLLFIDFLAVSWSSYAIVLLQAEIDLRAVQLGAQRVHRARLFIEDFVFGSSGILLLGPGFGMGMYYARREILAEKARFGVSPDLGGVDSVGAAREELAEAKKEK
ncbi:unnamed protein product [Sympodiomycopsis kandeliae]